MEDSKIEEKSAIDDKKVQEFEEQYKRILFNNIAKTCEKQAELILQIQKTGLCSEIGTDLPNLGITLNNKLVKLQKEFQKAGLSMYYRKNENYAQSGKNLITASFVGESIIIDLREYIIKGTMCLQAYDKILTEITKKKIETVQALEKSNSSRRFFAKIRKIFAPKNQQKISYTQEEIDAINAPLNDYKDIDSQLWNYNLRDNVIPSMAKKIKRQRYDNHTLSCLLSEQIFPDLQKLGLSDLIPELREALIEEYKKDSLTAERFQVQVPKKEEIQRTTEKEEIDRYWIDKKYHYIDRLDIVKVELEEKLSDAQELELKHNMLSGVISSAKILIDFDIKYEQLNKEKEQYEANSDDLSINELMQYRDVSMKLRQLEDDYKSYQNDVLDGLKCLRKFVGTEDINQIEQLQKYWGNIEGKEFPSGIDLTDEDKKTSIELASNLSNKYDINIEQGR